jgi:hypothetical protein
MCSDLSSFWHFSSRNAFLVQKRVFGPMCAFGYFEVVNVWDLSYYTQMCKDIQVLTSVGLPNEWLSVQKRVYQNTLFPMICDGNSSSNVKMRLDMASTIHEYALVQILLSFGLLDPETRFWRISLQKMFFALLRFAGFRSCLVDHRYAKISQFGQV